MRLTIFSRLIIGYLAIFILAMVVSVYSIAQLRQLENTTRSILTVDNRIIEYEKKLSDAFFSMIRYEKKFIIIKDKGLYKHFRRIEGEFSGFLEKTVSVAENSSAADILLRIGRDYDQYRSLFNKEAEFLMSGRPYPVNKYKENKENSVNSVLEGLRELGAYSQQNTFAKVKKLGEAEVNASRVAIVMGIISLAAGIIISIFITLNITRPLSVIKKKTRKIAEGDFTDDLRVSSPQEIAELARSFNSMCARLKELDKLKSDFFSLMSHELRTPLTTIKEGVTLFSEGMMHGETKERQKKLLTIINEETRRLINLVSSVLDFSKMEAGMMVYNFIDADIAPLINKVAREMGPLVETRDIMMEINTDRALPSIKVDTERMLQVLRNLMGNAVKFTPDGGDVRVFAQSVEKGVKVSVSDTGAGISKERTASIFDKYQQAAFTGPGRIKGTGLGLFIVRQIITAHGGKVWVESTPGHGSTFAFVLPA